MTAADIMPAQPANNSRRKRRGRERHQETAEIAAIQPVRPLVNTMAPMEPLSADQLETIHLASLQILAEQGMRVLSADARLHLAAIGAMVDEAEMMVRMDPALVMAHVANAPSRFTLTPRNPANRLHIGGNHVYFGMVSGPPNCHDTLRGRRQGNFADYRELISLGQALPEIHFFGNQTLAPTDLPVNTRHLDSMLANLTLSDKVCSTMSIGAGRVRDASRMIAISRGLTMDALAESPAAFTNINVNSPRVLDSEMSDAALELARHGQAVIVTPFTLMGAMTPVSFAAALAQQNAEALFTIALIQSAAPGAPVVYGGFTSNVDMKSGAPAFGTPENCRANMAGGQLARRYNLPYRTSACNASNCADAQSIWETQMALWGAVTGYGNMIYHAAGWLEGGLVASYEKLMLDAAMLSAMAALFEETDCSAEELALEAMAEVGPGGHFFGAGHTMARYRTAFHEPMLSDWQNNEAWQAAGGLTATERAAEKWQAMLQAFTPPPLEQAIAEELEAFVSKRKEEIGVGEP